MATSGRSTCRNGITNFRDLVEGLSMRDQVDESTGIASRVVIDWKQQPKGQELRPRITLRDDDGEVWYGWRYTRQFSN